MSAPRTVLITRPAEDATALARRIEALGHKTLTEPLLAIRFLDARVDLAGVQALAFTSANGVRACVHALGERLPAALPVFAVGRATAAAARAAGFERVHAAGGDVESLALLVRAEARPAEGAILHIAGRDRVGDLARSLAPEGFDLRRVVLYAADTASELSAATVAALRTSGIDDVTIFSPRTAHRFVTLIGDAGLRNEAARLRLLALSPRVAEAAGDIPFASVVIAERPDEDALIALLGAPDDGTKPGGGTKPDDGTKKDAMANASAGDKQDGMHPRNGSTPSTPPSRARHVLMVSVLSLAALAAAAAVVVLADPRLRRQAFDLVQGGGKTVQAEAPAPNPVDVLGARLDALAADIATLRRTQAPAPPAIDPARLDALARRLDETARRLDEANARLGALEAAAKSPAARPAADGDAFALLALAFALDAGRPFAAHLGGARAALMAMGPQASGRVAALDALAPRGEAGVPTASMLAARARALRPLVAVPAARATAPAPAPGEPAGLWERVKARLGGLVTVRRIGEGGGATPVPVAAAGPAVALAKVAGDFAAGDVAGAVSVLRAVDGAGFDAPSARELAALIADGEARLLADRLAAGPFAVAPAPR
ncbi:MAG: hypothetical protein RL477_1783 [Pseudomonadota bacterium]